MTSDELRDSFGETIGAAMRFRSESDAGLASVTTTNSMRERLRARRSVVVAIAAALVVAVGIAALVSQHGSTLSKVQVAAPSSESSTSIAAVTVTRDAAIAKVRALTDEVSATDSVEAKLMTWSDLQAAEPHAQSTLLTPSSPIWAVQVVGSYVPSFGGGEKFSWGILFVDAQTGDVVGTVASSKSPQAPYWTSLPDNSSAS